MTLTTFKMPTVRCWPAPDIDEYDLARFEIAMMVHIMPELEEIEMDHGGSQEHADKMRERLVNEYQKQAAEVVRKELIHGRPLRW